jgi:hypothetical protein
MAGRRFGFLSCIGAVIGVLAWQWHSSWNAKETVAAEPRPPLPSAEVRTKDVARVALTVEPGVAPHGPTIDELRALVHREPVVALSLLEAADRRGNDALEEEHAALRVDALVYADQIGRARDAAEEFLRRFPESDLAMHIESLTGVHPRPPETP